MRAKDVRQGLPVWVTRGQSTRPAIIVHNEDGRWWVSFTDKMLPPSASVKPAQLEKRGETR